MKTTSSNSLKLFRDDTDYNAIEEWMILGGDSSWIDNRFWSQITDERVKSAYDYDDFIEAWRKTLGEGGEWFVDSPGLGLAVSRRFTAVKYFIEDCNKLPDLFFKGQKRK